MNMKKKQIIIFWPFYLDIPSSKAAQAKQASISREERRDNRPIV
jgi:hypothetical protein